MEEFSGYSIGHDQLFLWPETGSHLKIFKVDWEKQNGVCLSAPKDFVFESDDEWTIWEVHTSFAYHEDPLASQLVAIRGVSRLKRFNGYAFYNHDDTRPIGMLEGFFIKLSLTALMS